ncbi:MAG TPA: type II toxin-antitoxin system RelE/ParE family toxin [Pirellulales bacterium]|nr:type II toxin-antitoxin system RelE/ParE family toxin [Pirellulales bacterium]
MPDAVPRYVIAPAAEEDIASILSWTHAQFGEQARLRYEALLTQAIMDVVDSPDLRGGANRPEIAPAAKTYHLFHSRNHVGAKSARVKAPRHFLLYRTRTDGLVEIGRVLHDSMDLNEHIPEDFRLPRGDA